MKTERTMLTTMSRAFLMVALLLVLAAGTGMNSCQVHDVQCGDVLDIDHGHYKLSGDLVCPLGSGITRFAALTITGKGVHFNLAGHTITRDDASGRILAQGIAVLGANAHINGGSIVDINCPAASGTGQDCAAIHLFEAPGATINGMSLHNNNTGIMLFGSGNADGARIHTNDITGNLR